MVLKKTVIICYNVQCILAEKWSVPGGADYTGQSPISPQSTESVLQTVREDLEAELHKGVMQ